MRINSATRSDVFNEYVKIISNFNLKHNKTASTTTQSLEELLAAAKTILPSLSDPLKVQQALKAIGNNFSIFDAAAITGKTGAGSEEVKEALEILASNNIYLKDGIYSKAKIPGADTITGKALLPGAKKKLLEQKGFNPNTVDEFCKNLAEARGIDEKFVSKEIKDARAADAAAKASAQGVVSAPSAETKVVETPAAPPAESPNVDSAKATNTTGDTPVPDPAEVLPQTSKATPSPSSPRTSNSGSIDDIYKRINVSKLKPILEDLLNEKDFIGFYTNIAMNSNLENAVEMKNLVSAIQRINPELLSFTNNNKSILRLSLNQKLDKEFIRNVMASIPDRVTSAEIGDFLTRIQKDGNNIKTLSDDFLKEIESRPAKSEILAESAPAVKAPTTESTPTAAATPTAESTPTAAATPAASAPTAAATPAASAPTPPAPVVAAVEALNAATPEEIRASIAALSSELSKSTKDMVGKIGAIEGNLSTLETSLKNFKDPEITQISGQLKTLQSDLKTLSERATQPAAAPVVAEEAKGLFSRIKEVLSERLITRLKGTPAAKAAEEAAATAEKSAKETEALAAATKRVKEAEEALKAAKSATTKPAEAAATSQAAKSIGSALKTLAGVGLAVGATYAVYKAVTGEDMPEEIADPTSSIGPVETGVPGSSENPINPNNSSEVSDSLSTPEGRANIQGQLNSLANSNPNSYNKLLSSMEKIFGATGKYKLERPIRIKGERIEYVFPRQAAGSRNPLDPGRAKAAEEYMYKLLENKGRKASNIKGRILTDANSENPMEIANYMFSTIANKGLFKGLGTGRAGRYGRGAGIREIENKGFSGSQEERMTRKERRALRDISRNQFDQGDETPLSDSFDSSLMESFSSGYNELFEKYSSDLDNSINNSEIMKKADKTSKRYFKDAVKDLSSDSFMSDYYAGFSKLYDSKVKKKKSDYSKLYDVQEETGSNRIHKAHPEAIVVADAIGNGGLVENASESSKAMQDVASRMPTGNYRARYAFIQNALKKASS